MKNVFVLLCFFINLVATFAQGLTKEYIYFAKKADSLLRAKDYKNSALTYSSAFKAFGDKGLPIDRYNAACSWALANYPDSAFFQLNRLATKGKYNSIEHITTDPDLIALHKDARWKPLIDLIKKNREDAYANLDKPLIKLLDSIYNEDQKYRGQLEGIDKKFGRNSKQMDSLWRIINTKDVSNLKVITNILDTRGWLGQDIIGEEGNSTLFLVIQHSDPVTQEKYLPMMREAVKNGKAQGSSLALLEDRILLRQNKKQIYGSQVGRDDVTGNYYVLPLEDPDNVDVRRASVGLQPLAEYIAFWKIKWDVNEYKKANQK